MKSKDQIFSLLRQHDEDLKALGVRRCGLFGSLVRDQAHAQSDVDVLVEFEPGRKTFDNFMQLSFLLEDWFGRRVDLVTPESLSPFIGPRILREVEYVRLGA